MNCNVLPTPKTVVLKNGFLETQRKINTDNNEWLIHLSAFCEGFKKIKNAPVLIADGGIMIKKDTTLGRGEYIIDIESSAVVWAADSEGVCSALATLLQLMRVSKKGFGTEKIYIKDAPDKKYRGLMVDLARCPHTKEQILKYMDVCFLAKLNYIHLHFIDDQAYTLPSRAFPKVNEKCRYYSEEDIKEICRYATMRGITIVPEFEAPGHAKFLIKSYPEIFANIADKDSATITNEQGEIINADNILCVGTSKALDGIKILLKEIAELFPDSPYIHIGGDEANIGVWNSCEHCKKYMQENAIENERELYCEFTSRIANAVLELGRTPVVWEGFPKVYADIIPRETIVIAWESLYHLANDLIDEGFKVINASWQPLYIVPYRDRRWGPNEIMDWNVYNWQNWWKKSKAYNNPINVPPTEQVIGAQLCAWEQTFEQEINFIMENSVALAERTWNEKTVIDKETFNKRHFIMMKLIASLISDL